MYLSEPTRGKVLREALTAVQTIGDDDSRSKTLAELAPHLPELLVWKALGMVRTFASELYRATALVTLAPRIAELGFPEAALVSARVIDYEDRDLDDRPGVLACVAPYLARLPRARLYPLWRETLHFLAIRTRPDLLADLGALVPVIVTLGGAEAVVETLHAVLPTGRRSQ